MPCLKEKFKASFNLKINCHKLTTSVTQDYSEGGILGGKVGVSPPLLS